MADTNNRVWPVSTPGKRHSPADVRREIFQSSGGATGLIAAGGGGVSLTPGTPMSVRLEPCSVRVRSEYAGRGDESYSFSVKTPQDVAIRTTGSGGGRTDVVALVVSDPVLEGKEIAETDAQGNVIDGSSGLDPNEFDYWDTHVFEDVPTAAARTTDLFRAWVRENNLIEGMAVPYAKVVQGANSVGLEGKVTQFYDPILARTDKVWVDQEITRDYESSGAHSTYYHIGPSLWFDIPEWASRAKLKLFVQGVQFRTAYEAGNTISGNVSGTAMGQDLSEIKYYESGASHYGRQSFTITGDVVVPVEHRGGTERCRMKMTIRESGSVFALNEWSHMFLEIDFFEDVNA